MSNATTSAEHVGEQRQRCPSFPLYAQVLVAIALAVLVGTLWPDYAKNDWIKAMGDGFIKLVKMAIAPLIFCTVVSGIAHVQDAAQIGRVAVKTLVYFEIISTFALGIGLLAANIAKPGTSMHVTPDAAAVEEYKRKHAAAHLTTVKFLLNIIPKQEVGAFVEGNLLQVIFFAIIFGFALMFQGDRAQTVAKLVDETAHVMFGIVSIIMRAAPLGAFGAMAFTVGEYGIGTLGSLFGLIGLFYFTALFFIIVVLGAVAAIARFNIFRLLWFIRQEILLVLASSSSEVGLPPLLEKMEQLGCSKSVVGLVVPFGYSFNLDGTNIYMTLATLFTAQALGVPLTLGEQLEILLVAMLTSKGASGVTGAGFVTLAATLGAVRPDLVPGLAILLGIDKFMAECRSLTNYCGNAVACVIVAWSEGALDWEKLQTALTMQETMMEDADLEKQAEVESDREGESVMSTIS